MENKTKSNIPKFCTYLKKLFEKSGESVSYVARSIGAERTSLHKAMVGERVLPYNVVHALAGHFQLSMEERREFFRLYDIMLQGEDVWENREAVASLLNYLSTIQFQSLPARAVTTVETLAYDNVTVQGEYAVQKMISTVLYHEIMNTDHAVIRLFLPPDMDLSPFFINRWLDGNKFEVEQLFCISSIGSSRAENIGLLKQVIPMSLVSLDAYSSFHFYESAGSVAINPLNYYIITPHYLILLGRDQSAAQIQKDGQIIGIYSDHFKSLIEHCDPLVIRGQNLEELFDSANATIDPNGYFYLMAQPCFGRYYTADIISKYFQVQNCPIPGIFETAVQHFALLQETDKNFCTVFSEKGLQHFIDTGIVEEMPPEYIPPAEVKDRVYLLSRLRSDIAEEKLTGLIARPSLLKVPDYLSMSIDSEGNPCFGTTTAFPRGAYYCNIHISEEAICQAFKDFCQSLPGSQMVYSKEETLRMLDEGIRKLSVSENL